MAEHTPIELPQGWEQIGDCVVCECGFRFGEEHPDSTSGEYSCPVCEEISAEKATAERDRLTASNDELLRTLRRISMEELPERDNSAWRLTVQRMKAMANAAIAKARGHE